MLGYVSLYAQTVYITQTNVACFPPHKFRFCGSDSACISYVNITNLSP
jgi:hypothetical protein